MWGLEHNLHSWCFALQRSLVPLWSYDDSVRDGLITASCLKCDVARSVDDVIKLAHRMQLGWCNPVPQALNCSCSTQRLLFVCSWYVVKPPYLSTVALSHDSLQDLVQDLYADAIPLYDTASLGHLIATGVDVHPKHLLSSFQGKQHSFCRIT